MVKGQEKIIEQLANNHLSEHNIEGFISESFIQVLVDRGKTPDETQARASVTGNTFEICLRVMFNRYYPELEFERNVPLDDACMGGGQGADFVFYDGSGRSMEDIHTVVEAKGSADRLEWPDGTVQEPSRPGLKRTDTMKKAICQAYQVKQGLDYDVNFCILTTHEPTSGNAKCIYDLAVGDIVDDVVDVTDKKELDSLVEEILD